MKTLKKIKEKEKQEVMSLPNIWFLKVYV